MNTYEFSPEVEAYQETLRAFLAANQKASSEIFNNLLREPRFTYSNSRADDTPEGELTAFMENIVSARELIDAIGQAALDLMPLVRAGLPEEFEAQRRAMFRAQEEARAVERLAQMKERFTEGALVINRKRSGRGNLHWEVIRWVGDEGILVKREKQTQFVEVNHLGVRGSAQPWVEARESVVA